MSRPAVYLFGPFALDATAFRLTREGQPVSASPKVLDLLRYLLDRPSALVTKDELFKAIWPDVIVTDNALTQAVSELRQLLGDDPAKPTYIQTVARRGYRFVATVQTTALEHSRVPAIEPEIPAIAVLDFTNVTREPSVEWLSTGIAETVTNDLRALDGIRVIDRVRVIESAKRAGGALDRIGADLGVRMAIVGSFQKAGDRLRITARAVDIASSEVVADAKADGLVSSVFELQDRIFNEMAGALGALGAHGRSHDRTPRETSSIEAYRAFTEGRVVLETLDASAIPEAIAHFERAIEIDERYPQAHVGLANARFFQYELSRAQNHPEGALLATAIAHVRRAIEIDRNFAESHATLSFLLVSAGRSAEAQEAARRAVRLEASYWGHHFRLGHATWGDERLAALTRTLELYPQFPFAHFEIAMVHIARGARERAGSVLREGAVVQDQQADRRQRYPAKGLHWLLGLVRLAAGDVQDAALEFDREISGATGQLYAAEFRMNACDGAGFAQLRARRTAEAAAMFRRALEHYPDHARSLLGLASALRAAGDVAGSDAARARAAAAIDALRRGGRGSEATLSDAFAHAVAGRSGEAVAALHRLLDEADLPFTGWTIPIEPLLEPLHGREGFAGVLKTLQDRAS